MLARPTVVLVLLLLSATQQWRLIARAPLPAQDAVEIVAVAQRIRADGLVATIRREPVAPLFPYTVYAVHTSLNRLGLLDEAAWDRAAQIAAALPAILAVVPIFLLARRLAGRDAAMVAAVLYCLLPATSRLGADGLGDALHLCLGAFAMWSLVEACQAFEESETTLKRSLAWSLTAGVFVCLALLCRAEILMLVPAVMLIGALGLSPPRRFRPFALSGGIVGCFACGCLTCLVPYVACGVVTPVEILVRLQGGGTASTDRPLNAALTDRELAHFDGDSMTRDPIIRDGAVLEFGRKDRSRSIRTQDVGAATLLFLHEFLQACGYVVLPLALVGTWFLRARMGSRPWLFLTCFVVVYLMVVYSAAIVLGYVTSRHFLLPVVAMLPAAGIGLVFIAERIRARFAAYKITAGLTQSLTTALAVACVCATLQPPHHTHAAHRRAADWLRSPAAAEGFVLDQHGWTALSTGRPTYRFDEAETALTDPRLRYVLVERIDLEAASPRGKSLRAVLGSADRAVERFVDVRGRAQHDVLLFARTPSDALALRDSLSSHFSSLAARRNATHAQ